MKSLDEIKKAVGVIVTEEGYDGIFGYYHDPISYKRYLFVFSWGGGWEHLSVSTSTKCPTWEVMCRMKDIFWNEDEVCVEYHPRKKEYVNNHPFCLHIWRPIEVDLPTPPTIFVGYTDEELEK